jgi:hypothetical protein
MTDKLITLKMLEEVGGLDWDMTEPRELNIPDCEKKGTWPKSMPMPDKLVFFGTRTYKRSAIELASEFGTTPRQISKLRNGHIEVAKPLTWYEENRKHVSGKRSSNRENSFTPVHLPTGM